MIPKVETCLYALDAGVEGVVILGGREIFILGDGVDDKVRAAVRALQAADSRIRFFDMPKGPRRGELNRDRVLREARSAIVCYACDDDLWLPGHLQSMEE